MSKLRDYQSWKLKKLSNPIFAAHYLNEIENSSPELVLAAIQNVVRARGEVTSVAKEAGVARENIYRAFSEQGNPTVTTFRDVLRAVGLTMKFEAIEAGASPAPISGVPSNSELVTERSGYRIGDQSTFKVLSSSHPPASSLNYDAHVYPSINISPIAAQPLSRGHYQPWLQVTQPPPTPHLNQSSTTDEQVTFSSVMPIMSSLNLAYGI